jgi:hypothetical protein
MSVTMKWIADLFAEYNRRVRPGTVKIQPGDFPHMKRIFTDSGAIAKVGAVRGKDQYSFNESRIEIAEDYVMGRQFLDWFKNTLGATRKVVLAAEDEGVEVLRDQGARAAEEREAERKREEADADREAKIDKACREKYDRELKKRDAEIHRLDNALDARKMEIERLRTAQPAVIKVTNPVNEENARKLKEQERVIAELRQQVKPPQEVRVVNQALVYNINHARAAPKGSFVSSLKDKVKAFIRVVAAPFKKPRKSNERR